MLIEYEAIVDSRFCMMLRKCFTILQVLTELCTYHPFIGQDEQVRIFNFFVFRHPLVKKYNVFAQFRVFPTERVLYSAKHIKDSTNLKNLCERREFCVLTYWVVSTRLLANQLAVFTNAILYRSNNLIKYEIKHIPKKCIL